METRINILVIDDDAAMRDACFQALTRSGHDVMLAKNGQEGMALLDKWAFAVIFLDLQFPNEDGMKILQQIKAQDPEAAVVIITGHGTIQTAVKAIKLGAFEFLTKPFTPNELRRTVERAFKSRQLNIENVILKQTLKEKEKKKEEIISQSPSMTKVKEMIKMVAPTDSTVLIQGESGTGKGLVARKLHAMSPRRDHPFVVMDCGSLVSTLFESELFGHVKGAFTGADTTQYGKFEMANGGTIFFDEIANINLDIQAKLLKVVEEKAISKVGSHRVIKVDTRIIAASNKDLQRAIRKGLFREDLFFRLNVVSIHLPPLRDRKVDIPLLVDHFLDIYSAKQGKTMYGVSKEALAAMENYAWPGNVRELENMIERLVIFARGETITFQDFIYSNTTFSGISPPEAITLEEAERQHIGKMLERFNRNITKTAEALGIDRKTLRAKIKKYSLVV
ncbi:MAG: sigma-54-dependent Fis family transcriptional regulator [Desulfobacteraceae bacterium]|nr:MAG: sigma-54-dependent Fis family transcriptional regulator [Desulfobacteraceae bacterium]